MKPQGRRYPKVGRYTVQGGDYLCVPVATERWPIQPLRLAGLAASVTTVAASRALPEDRKTLKAATLASGLVFAGWFGYVWTKAQVEMGKPPRN
jgi:hypothetical protein